MAGIISLFFLLLVMDADSKSKQLGRYVFKTSKDSYKDGPEIYEGSRGLKHTFNMRIDASQNFEGPRGPFYEVFEVPSIKSSVFFPVSNVSRKIIERSGFLIKIFIFF